MSRPVQGGSALPVAITGSSEAPVKVDELAFNPVGPHYDGPVISAAIQLVAQPNSNKLLIQALTQNVRFTLDGTVPTASLGFQLRAGDPPTIIPIGTSTIVKVIQEAATADLQYQWGN